MKRVLITFIILISFLIAQEFTSQEHPCLEDIQTFCAELELGTGKVIKCLLQHSFNLSEKCKEFIKKRNPCAKISETLCPGMQPDQIRKCLIEHKDQIPQNCKKYLSQRMKCKKFIKKLCGDVRSEVGKECLRENKSQISAVCSREQ